MVDVILAVVVVVVVVVVVAIPVTSYAAVQLWRR